MENEHERTRDLVIDAHGGIARWNKVKTIEVTYPSPAAVGAKGWPDVLKNVHVTAAAGNQWISYQPFIREGMRSSMHPRPHRDRGRLTENPSRIARSPRRL